jgi:hypothetical protein
MWIRRRAGTVRGAMARLRSQLGQTAAEYVGVLLLVSVIIAGVASTAIGDRIACHLRTGVDHVFGGHATGCGGAGGADDGSPRASAAAAGKDSDGDGISDAEERRRGTDPALADSDHDGVSDKDEIEAGLNPRDPDTDHDGLADGLELDRDSDPFDDDTDDDGKVDGSDKDPLHYDAGLEDAIAGAICGDSDLLLCPDDDDPVRASTEYLVGQLVSGVVAVGDVRDFVNALLHGKVGDALWAAAGIVPAAGDAAKFGKKVHDLIKRFPGRKAELLTILQKILPSRFKRVALDAATDGGYSALRRSGLSDDTIENLARRGNDLSRIARNARVSERTLSSGELASIRSRVDQWPAARRSEAWGIETALHELQKNPNVEILLDGRPGLGRPVNGPDIVAIDRSTGRAIIVEAKGTQGGRLLGGGTLRSTAGGRRVTQTEPAWLSRNPERYLGPLESSNDPRLRRAAAALRGVNRGDGYDVKIVNSRPTGQGGYGSRLDEATDAIRRGGQVGDLDIIDVQRL